MEKLSSSPKRSLRYEKLAHHFRQQVQSRELKPGDQLPSFAQMQAQFGIGQGTLEKVYAILESERLVVRLPKRGTFVAEPSQRRALNVVGVALGQAPREHDYFGQLVHGINDVAYERGVEVLVLHRNSEVHWEKMDGLLFADMPIFLPPGMPVVSLIRSLEGVPCISVDERGGTYALTRHLLELGHRKIAYLHTCGDYPVDPTRPSIAKLRVSGYRDALAEAGIKAPRQWMMAEREPWEWAQRVGREYDDIGYEKMSRWLDADWHRLGCTALLAHNDDMAAGIMRAFREHGIRVPEDVSVVGYDGTAVSRQMTPRLTTVTVPLREVGARGMECLLAQIQLSIEEAGTFQPTALQEDLPTQLVVRESSAPPPGNRA